ncbi:nitrate reductase [Biformimicrobium ophioploci]|uniref:Nitrate reductase n=1 Tax=Biformimicrobium ophioploci TaxID=3036711 RepID=A0ABQ6M0B0_9GAMM|nr:nitrate reductase [Microbulbifer sp. NKW57]
MVATSTVAASATPSAQAAQVSEPRIDVSVSGDSIHPANRGNLCVKGSALAETLVTQGRLLRPRLHGVDCDWDTAMDAVAHGFREAIARHGPDSVAFYLSGQLLTEDYYVANKLMKGFIGSANVDTNSRLCMSSAVAAHKRAFGADTVPGCYADLEEARLLVLVGSNAAWTHPILFQRMQAARAADPGKKIVVIDPRRNATCQLADLHLALKPGTDALLFNGLLHYLHSHGHTDAAFIGAHTEHAAAALAAAQAMTPEQTARECGLDPADLLRFYQWFAAHPQTVSFYSQGVNQSVRGTDGNNAIINCHLATGRIGKPGAAPFSITGQPNAMGGREVGGLANQLAAHMEFNSAHIALLEKFWRTPNTQPNVAPAPGLKAVELFEAVERGQIKALWVMATNPAVSLPQSDRIRRALQKCELLVVSDCSAESDTLQLADIALPATGWSEKDGTVTNSERRISRQRGFLPAPGDARHDWQIVCDLAQRLGYGEAFDYQSPRDIFVEHAALSGFENHGERAFDISALARLSAREYDQLGPLQWPVTEKYPGGRKRLYDDGHFYTESGRARFVPVQASAPQPDTAQPSTLQQSAGFLLNTGRSRDQWHTMTRTGQARRLQDHQEAAEIHMHPGDMQRLAISDGQLLRLGNAEGMFLGFARTDTGLQPGHLFAPIHWSDSNCLAGRVDALVPALLDPISGQPQFKQTAVSLQAVAVQRWATLLLPHAYAGAIISALGKRGVLQHWYRVQFDAGMRLELALSGGVDWKALLGTVLPQAFDWHWRAMHAVRGQRLVASDHALQLQLFEHAERAQLPDRRTLEQRFSADLPGHTGAWLVAPADPGRILCSCLQVGERAVREAIGNGCDTVEALGESLRCGTGCGSCKPELTELIMATQPELIPALQE